MSTWLVFVKSIKKIMRTRSLLLIILLSPVIFFGFFGFIFSGFGPEELSYSIGVFNTDLGTDEDYESILPTAFAQVDHDNLAELMINLLENSTTVLVETDIEITIISYEDDQTMIDDIQTRNLHLGIIFPSDFTKGVLSGYQTVSQDPTTDFETGINTTISTYGDQTISDYQSAHAIFEEALDSFSNLIFGFDRFAGIPLTGGYLDFTYENIMAEEISPFESFAPGFIVFLVLLQMMSVAALLTDEKEKQTINRLKLSYMRSWELFAGILLTQFVTFTVQYIETIVIVGIFDLQASLSQWVAGYIVLQISNINISGIALIVASWVSKTEDAMSITGIASAPLGFLSGIFVPVPDVWISKSLNIQIWDVIPTYHSAQALVQILIENATLLDVSRSIIWLSIFTVVWFIIGLLSYQVKVIKQVI